MTLREFRHKHGISQRTLADEAGVSIAMISRIENGSDKLSLTALRKVSLATGGEVSVAELVAPPSRDAAA